MAVADLPDPHLQLVFAMLLFRDAMIGPAELRSHAISAFGADAGAAIADDLLRLPRPVGLI